MTRRAKRLTAPALLAALGLWLSAGAGGQDLDFSEGQLRAGQDAFRAQRLPEAIDHFRIAAFGFLNRPELLSGTLVRLALAQHAARRSPDVAATVERFLDVERRFGSFAAALLEPDTRAAFRRLLEVVVPRQTLAEIPSLATSAPGAAGGAVRGGNPATGRPTSRSGAAARPTPAPTRPVERRPTPGVGRSESQSPEPLAAAGLPSEQPGAETRAVYEAPRYRETVKPLYPAAVLRSGIGGIVLLKVLVSAQGKAVEIGVVRPVHPELSSAAVGAVSRWEFVPAKRNGVAVAAWTTIPIRFHP